MEKCKGHATEQDVDEGKATARTKKGNNHADVFACRGADIAEDVSDNSLSTAAYL